MKNSNIDKEKYRRLFLLVSSWWMRKNDGFNIADLILKMRYRKIAIYGMDRIGLILLEELSQSEIEVCYGIDKNAYSIFCPIVVNKPDDNLETVDAVIVTAICYYDDIVATIGKKLKCPIISLESLVYSPERYLPEKCIDESVCL